jgi:hypothetical protein
MKRATRKRNLDEDKAQAQKDKAVAFLRRVGNDDAADKLEDESLESYAVRKGIRVDNPRRQAKKKPAKKRNRPNPVKKRKRNAFGLDRFFGSKPRVTSTDWNRAGETRRAAALRSAGVSKKLLPVYTDMSWRDMQGLDSKFVTKVMSGLPKRNSRRVKARKSVARKRTRVKTKKNTSTTAIGKKIHALMLDGMSRQEAAKAAQRLVSRGRTKPGKYKRGARRNPGGIARAGETYAMFHGRGPKEVVTVMQLEGDPTKVAALGDLTYLVVGDGDSSSAYKIHWGSGDQRPFLATNAKATQLYIMGGDQNLEATIRQLGVSNSAQDLLDLGEVLEVEYFTQKDFDDFAPIRYYHKFGEEDAKKNPRGRIRRPRLIYSRRLRKMMLAGGAYKIKKDGIIN